jgi:hypothetical protein
MDTYAELYNLKENKSWKISFIYMRSGVKTTKLPIKASLLPQPMTPQNTGIMPILARMPMGTMRTQILFPA